jgi:SAM-dependent methyltransferase
MVNDPYYRHYVGDETFLTNYNAYQKRFVFMPRECDKITIALVGEIIGSRDPSKIRLLDIGCSTGNLLRHLRHAFPKVQMTGGDLARSSLEQAKRDPALADVSFVELDIHDLPPDRHFDIVVVNAVLYMMTDEQFHSALRSIAGALVPNGSLVLFDFFHSFNQLVLITEYSESHPEGLPIAFRPSALVGEWLRNHGYERFIFRPFTLPIDLPKTEESDARLITYTVKTDKGLNLPFRGTLFQPWCHVTAIKS